MLQEEQRSIVDAWQARTETSIEAVRTVFLAYVIFFRFPLHPKRWIGQHVVEFFARMPIVRHKTIGLVLSILDAQSIAVDQVVDRLVLD
ncbi:hypothetical protein D3C75_867440 [compost metagenome]